MATFKLGAIVTELVGSIGGTTFKRNGSYRVAMNKNNGSTYSRLLTNKALSYLSFIFKSWSTLSSEVQDTWNTQALSYVFPDKFGDLRNISGRQLFIKLNSQRWQFFLNIVSPEAVNNTLYPFVLTGARINWGDRLLLADITVGLDLTQYYAVMVETTLQPLRSPVFIKRKVVRWLEAGGGTEFSIDVDITTELAYLNTDYNVRVYVYAFNLSGFQSVQQYANAVWLP